jgi:hypothetical protein
MRVLSPLFRGALVGLAAVTSCSGMSSLGAPPASVDLAAASVTSPCGGGDTTPLPIDATPRIRQGFDSWPLPPVFISNDELDGDAVACFDGVLILVYRPYAEDRVILAHEFCHAVAFLHGHRSPPGFPVPARDSPRARALDLAIWEQEIWAVTCSTAVTGERDWTWGHLVDDTTPEALSWAHTHMATGPTSELSAPYGWKATAAIPHDDSTSP